MSTLSDILQEEYIKQIGELDLKMLMEMVEEVFESVPHLSEEAPAPASLASQSDDAALEMILKMIPDIAVSEIGWSDVRTTEEGVEIKGPQRRLLEDYLNNIQGSDLAEKISGVSQFYTNGAGLISEQAGEDRTKRIVQAISYLVFYKTLTKVITNFNASSAGFSFESFLAALVNGRQIPANTGTIADYTDRSSGDEIPVSLKLYKEGQLEVGGSFTDLVNDLVTPKYMGLGGAMRYVICTKELSGKDLEQEGKINFYQFDFTLQNVMDILSQSRLNEVIRLPSVVLSAIQAGQQAGAGERLGLAARDKQLSSEELTPMFNDAIKKQIEDLIANEESPLQQFEEDDMKKLLDELNWEKNDEIFNNDKVRGSGALNSNHIFRLVKKLYPDIPAIHKSMRVAIIAANNEVVISQKAAAKKSERKNQIAQMIADGEFLSPEDSAREYKVLGESQKKQALLNTLGYLQTHHFALNQTQSTNPGEPTNTLNLGAIMVGRRMVANAMENVRELLNEEVYEIFQSLKLLSDSLNEFFAGGLEDDKLATSAIGNAENISSKDILQTDK
ncbi:MAG TPA: hypothetical protein EYN67_10585 [Flavobacteriales bacterium]|nr:hypothetical protein [Flavobacteriales bacterium]